MHEGSSSRLHTPTQETDWYKHLKDFDAIDRKDEYSTAHRKETFNPSNLEVFHSSTGKYLSISVCPNTPDSYQFHLAFGIHSESDGEVISTAELYGARVDNSNLPKELIRLFFNQDFDKNEQRFNKMDFFAEVNDLFNTE